MRFHKVGSRVRVLWQSSLLAGLLALPIGCGQTDSSEHHAPAARRESAAQKPAPSKATASSTPAPTLDPTRPVPDGLDDLKQVLARKFDPAQMITRPASPQGGVLHIPNGWVAHAAVVVKNPDGTVRRACVSSNAEVSALVEQQRKRGGQ